MANSPTISDPFPMRLSWLGEGPHANYQGTTRTSLFVLSQPILVVGSLRRHTQLVRTARVG